MQITASTPDPDQPAGPGNATGMSDTCHEEELSAWGDNLDNLPGHHLHTQVNGPGLRELLYKIPHPTASPAATSTPPASTHQP